MEAVAKYDFVATAVDELSFTKGSVIKILSDQDDENWFKGELDGKEGFVPRNYISVKDHDWFLGNVPRLKAEAILMEQEGGSDKHPEGAFLVRESESAKGEFSMSVKCKEGVQHFKVLRDKNLGKYFLWVHKFNSINELVEYHKYSSISPQQRLTLRDCIRKDNQPQQQQHHQQHHQQQQQHTTGPPPQYALALFDFEAQQDCELDLVKGDRILVLKRSDKDWWEGEKNNKCGLFPATYVSLQGP